VQIGEKDIGKKGASINQQLAQAGVLNGYGTILVAKPDSRAHVTEPKEALRSSPNDKLAANYSHSSSLHQYGCVCALMSPRSRFGPSGIQQDTNLAFAFW
jgi:hypothetical protein